MSTQIFINPSSQGPQAAGLYAQTESSDIITGITPGTLIGSGVGTLSVPANGFQVGDSFVVSMGGVISSRNNEQLRIQLRSAGVILGDTGLITMPQTTNQNWDLQVRFTIRTIGAATVASISSFGQFTYSKDASNAFEGSDFSVIENTLFNTTILNTLDITAVWGTDDPLNRIYSDNFVLTKIY